MHVCKEKTVGYPFFPCMITDLYVKVGVEIIKGEEKGHPLGAFPNVLKLKQSVAAASRSDDVLHHFMLQQRAVWDFQKKHFEWQKKIFDENFKGKIEGETHVFPHWVLE